MPQAEMTCPVCFKADADERATCINRPQGMCPEPIPQDPSMVVIRCAAPCGGPCGKHLAVPLGSIMKRKRLTELGTCISDTCRARVVHPRGK